MAIRTVPKLMLLWLVVMVTTAGDARPIVAGGAAADQAVDRGTVVLLHGLGRTHRSMRPVEAALLDEGYRVVNFGYPYRTHTWDELVDTVGAVLNACCAEPGGPVHFVTHSMGGLLVRAHLAEHALPGLGRVVMLSPPNQGTEVVNRLPEDLLRLVLGPASVQLGTGPGSVPIQLGPVDFELGVITGDASINPLFSYWLAGDDDGTVPVRSAWVQGTDDFLIVPYTHTFIMRKDEVILQILAFLETGHFVDTGVVR